MLTRPTSSWGPRDPQNKMMAIRCWEENDYAVPMMKEMIGELE